LEASRNEASGLRSKVSAAESDARMARTEAKRHEGDAKLAIRKATALEGKLERSIKMMAEAEEKLERREAELKRVKELAKPALQPQPAAQTVATVKPVSTKAVVDGPKPEIPVKSDDIVAEIAALRPALRAATTANNIERGRLKDEMMQLAGRLAAEAALQNPTLVTKIAQLKPGSALANAILKHNKTAE
jgi:hypothetical protein